MRLSLTILSVLLSVFNFTLFSQIPETEMIPIEGVKEARYIANSLVPNFIQFEKGKEIPADKAEEWLKANFELDPSFALRYKEEQTDDLGYLHIRFTQWLHGHPVANTMYILHTKNGLVESMNGFLVSGTLPDNRTMAEQTAFDIALNYVGASSYKWELEEEEAFIKLETGDPSATWKPMPELVYASPENDYQSTSYKLTYCFDVYAHQPLSRQLIYVDANTGGIIKASNKIHTSDSLGLAVTKYSGVKTMVADFIGTNSFRLRETGRGNGIQTYDMNEGTSYGAAVDFTDTDNYWNNVNANIDEAATDAHWGAEMTYDYFFLKHGRNSINGTGFMLRSYIHYNSNYSNAFWDGQRMTYGDGNGTSSGPFVALDIAGHEITHGLTTFTADLDYSYESGALNESFSDVFGAAIEFYGKPTAANWTLGENIGFTIRSMSNPKALSDPDTYLGQYWYTGSGDNGGVHTNSGVQNHWFYLMTMGGNGTNDNNQVYNIQGLGMDKAGAIAFRNLTVYLYPTAQYADARFYAIKSAADLYGACSPEIITTTNAWYAVGVGAPYSASATVNFLADQTTSCTGIVNFTNLTTGSAISWNWDFGDGTNSTAFNPSHFYAYNGNYNIKLLVSTCIGHDSVIKSAYITIAKPAAPPVTGDVLCDSGIGLLSASGTGALDWYDSPVGGNLIDTGHAFTTPFLTSSLTYYVEEKHIPASQFAGPANNNFGNGGYFSGDHRWLKFDCFSPVSLVSVLVYAGSAANRTIELRNSGGSVLQSKTVFIPSGSSRVTLNFNVPAGTDLVLAINGTADLYRHSSGPSYPYTIPGKISIKSSNASNPTAYYYFFYDWEIKDEICISERSPVTALVIPSPIPQISLSSSPELCEGSALNLTADPGYNYNWSTNEYTQSISVTSAGFYSVTVTDTNGCSGVSQVIQVTMVPAPVASFGFTQNNHQVQFQDNSTFSSTWFWDFGDGNTSTMQHPTHQYQSSGVYMVMFVAINGDCSDTVFTSIAVFGTGIGTNPGMNSLIVYPNPTSDYLTIDIPGLASGHVEFEIRDVLCALVSNQIADTGLGKESFYIPVGHLADGTYLIKIQAVSKVYFGKFVKVTY